MERFTKRIDGNIVDINISYARRFERHIHEEEFPIIEKLAAYEDISPDPGECVKRPVGEWKKDESCPFCGYYPYYAGGIHTLFFCGKCGADMRGKKKNADL